VDREGLADFLRRRRQARMPSDVGLDAGERRRTPGLRREEIAALAHISPGFYRLLERGRGSRPSLQTTDALADALRLTPRERDHLYALAGHLPLQPSMRPNRPTPQLVTLIAHINVPAQIVTDLGETLAQNEMARALVGDQTQYNGPQRSIIYRWFTDPAQRRIHPEEDHAWHSRSFVAWLRAAHGARPNDSAADELRDLLLEESPEFTVLWGEHEVGPRTGPKRFRHPIAGMLELHCSILTTESPTERLVVFSPVPGSQAEQRLRLLAASFTRVGEPMHAVPVPMFESAGVIDAHGGR
jgi:transcriptional regulator with XRE-family HTH domain